MAASLDAALKEAQTRSVPLVIAYCMPDSAITTDLRALTGAEGEIVFFPLDAKHKDTAAFQRRYGPAKPGAILTDEFGNLLEGAMTHSDDAVEAFYYIDELTADQFQRWADATQKGKALLDQKQYAAAAAHLKIFAFARGSKDADQGRKLFTTIAPVAAGELKEIVSGREVEALKQLPWPERKALIATLSAFEKKWAKTPAAFSAEDLKNELASIKSAR